MRFNHIIWDYDGTLFDTYPVMATAFRDALADCSITEPIDTIISFMTISMGDTAKHYKEKYQLDDAFFERFTTQRKKAELENAKPFTGIIDLCHNICAHGGKNHLLTHRGESAIHFMEKYDILTNFTELITAKQNFPRKPSPNAILYLIDKYSFSSDDAIMIGDRDLDVLSGKNAGIRSCYFSIQGKKSEFADFNINCISELNKILEIKN